MLASNGMLAGRAVALVTLAALAGLQLRGRLGASGRRALAAVLAACIALGALALAGTIAKQLPEPRDWDFKVFWLSGRAAAQGLDPYAREGLERAAAAVPLSGSFRFELVARGSPYPPPMVALLVPLGRLELRAAAALWLALQAALLCASIGLLWREFFRSDGALGLAACAALALAFRPTSETFWFAQTHFALLTALLLFWRGRDRLSGGAWLGLGFTIKPIFAALALLPAARFDWRSLFGFAAALGALWALALAALGGDLVASYFLDSPLARRSARLMAQVLNQSLLAVLLRALEPDLAGRSPLWHPAYLASALALLGATGALLARKARACGAPELGLVLAFAVLVYPAALHRYAALLLFPLCALWHERAGFGSPAAAIAAIVALAWLACRGGDAVFATSLLTWCAMAALSWRTPAPSALARAGGRAG